ncbi:MAG TPA: 4-alpha-glucanotransferase [Syntrophales bacterium]|nr:4-alpha-glucanotransferase [Syntrophales bacterium]HOX93714.1 4-alpha-glucanotransferase [Syntrophales bacterium]HPI57059.1 4-alpha-glucanotransferase [Syntrophales bacterium]HPN23811.1 4-alpha-glucanotransferase [Syntrophales bacterium]HQM30118.1 4-alpha-glucanotransferase [Syntrophales bacterium]
MRVSGILLHITSLPSRFGIGDLGPEACRFADFLHRAGQRCWQVLPLCPTDAIYGNSPYNSASAFAGNVLIISPEEMAREGFLKGGDIRDAPSFPEGDIDYTAVKIWKENLFRKALEIFRRDGQRHADEYQAFCDDNKGWLDDHALFTALKGHYRGRVWNRWPRPVRDRDPAALKEARANFADAILREKFLQFLFYRQWKALRHHVNKRGIEIIGDLPVYVHYDSADVWQHPEYFMLGENKRPAFVAGVPPDYFSKTGQLWGNPLYRWEALGKHRYRWWVDRIVHNLGRFDRVRIDHFRGFVAFWQVPSGAKTAVRGKWVQAPAGDLFRTILKHVPRERLIAEDLGFITPDVTRVLEKTGLAGMRVLLFAFEEGMAHSPHAPHNHIRNCIVYTGTHDNNTVRGWFENEAGKDEKKRLSLYVGKRVRASEAHREFIRLAMMSVAERAVIPMQDVLGLGERARMNRPSTRTGNWQWRLLRGQVDGNVARELRALASIYGRLG